MIIIYKTLSVSVKACLSHTMISLVFDNEHASDGLGHCFCKKTAPVISKNIQELTLPWYNRSGWLGVKHQAAYLLTKN